MADRPIITTLASGALYDTDTLNTNFQNLRDEFDNLLGRNGTSGANNTMTGDVDWANKIARNVVLDDPTNTVATNPDGSAGAPAFSFTSDTDTGMFRVNADVLGFSGEGFETLRLSPLSSAVNNYEISNNVTTGGPKLAAIGTDTNIESVYTTKGTGFHRFFTNATGQEQVRINHTASAVNRLELTGGATGNAVSIDAEGETNVDIGINPKGTGGIVVGAATGGGQGTDTVNAANLFINGVAVSAGGSPRSYLAGFGMVRNGIDNKDLDIAAGECRSDDNTETMLTTTVLVKQIDATWAVGTNAGGLDTGAVAANTWYHMFVIKRTDTNVVDVLFSLSPTAPTLPTSYTKQRRIGAIRTDGSSDIIQFDQEGDEFLWLDPIQDVNAINNLGTAASSFTLTVPTGVRVWVRIIIKNNTGESGFHYFSSLDVNDEAPSSANPGSITPPSAQTSASLMTGTWFETLRTNTSAQIRARSTAASQDIGITTQGWIDRRGRDD